MTLVLEIREKILQAIGKGEVHLFDPDGDGSHLEAYVVSPSFKDLNLIEQQRIVMNALREDFEENLHALSLKTYTPQEWEKENICLS